MGFVAGIEMVQGCGRRRYMPPGGSSTSRNTIGIDPQLPGIMPHITHGRLAILHALVGHDSMAIPGAVIGADGYHSPGSQVLGLDKKLRGSSSIPAAPEIQDYGRIGFAGIVAFRIKQVQLQVSYFSGHSFKDDRFIGAETSTLGIGYSSPAGQRQEANGKK